jgi:hypothetical protein
MLTAAAACANDFRKSHQYPLEMGKPSAIMTREVRPRADGLVRIHFKGAFGRVLSPEVSGPILLERKWLAGINVESRRMPLPGWHF